MRLKVFWVAMMILATLVALYALAVLTVPGFGPPFVGERRLSMPLALSAHLAGSLWALAVGPWQLNQRLRDRSLGRHRWLGRSYVVGVLVGGAGALYLAQFAETGTIARLGFTCLAVTWLTCTVMAFVRIRQGNRVDHRRWMIRSYALTLAAVTLRLYLPASFGLGVPFASAYPVIAWICWVPNLIVAEAILAWRTSRTTGSAALS